LPLFWEADSFAGAVPFTMLLVRLVSWLPAFRLLMVWVHDRTGSLPLAMFMHASLVANQLIFLPRPAPGAESLVDLLVLPATLWSLVAVVAIAGRFRRSIDRAAQAGPRPVQPPHQGRLV
jgi:hypothetical protein